MKFSILLLVLVFLASESEGVAVDPPSALGPVWNHISLLMEAVKQKDAEVVIQLFLSSEADHNNVDRFLEVFQGQNIHVDSATIQKDGTTITSDIKIGDKFPATLTLVKCDSMTGLRITNIASEKIGTGCAEGLLGCAIKVVE